MAKRRIKIQTMTELVDWPLCEAMLGRETIKFWQGRGRPGNRKGTMTCGNFASYIIGGKHYCGKHAGGKALQLAVDAGGIQPL